MRALASAALTPTPSTSTPVETRLAASPASAKGLPAFRRALLTWYDRHRRDLPWRKTRDPYRIWLSEIMLQQTRVAAVLEHYRLFHERFPNVRALAAASESKVLAAWSGLGYYRRARMLRQCAREIVELHRGRFPKNSEALQALPGIGRYTAAAIASIAFDETAAVVDGNVERVLQRLVGSSLTAKQTWQRAQSHLSSSRPGDFNQAMMELGATVCTPRQPKCGMCPVRKWCATQGEAPRPVPVPSQIRKEIWCALDQRGGHVLLVQRPGKASLMAGMWELPQWSEPSRRMPGSKPASRTAAERRKITALWRTFRHSITVTDYTVHVIRAAAPAARGNWIPIAKLSDVPITGLTRKILKAGGII